MSELLLRNPIKDAIDSVWAGLYESLWSSFTNLIKNYCFKSAHHCEVFIGVCN
jgi:hypothetical protein